MNELNYVEMGIKIYKLRVQRGMNEEELAEKAQLSRFTVSKLEQGKTKPTANTLYKVIQALECTPNYLFGVNCEYAFIEKMTPAELKKLNDFFEIYNKR